MSKILPICIAIILIATLFVAGCTDMNTGCIPAKIEKKEMVQYSLSQEQRLTLTISGEQYKYYNAKLDTFSKINESETYQVKFMSMLGERPYVELCGE